MIHPYPKRRHHDDTGSIPLALVVTTVGLALSAVLVSIVLTQIRSTRSDVRRDESLHAAQAGLDVAIAQITAASTGTDADGNPVGDVTKLPCDPLSGDVGGDHPAHYRVTVDYFAFEPSPADYLDAHANYDDNWINSQRLACGVGVPSYALIRSQGADAGQDIPDGTCRSTMRCLRATYRFTPVGQSGVGGQIHVYRTPTGNDLCLSAGSTTLTVAQLAGTALTVAPCDASQPAQIFAYNSDLTLVLVASKTSDAPGGLCLDNRTASGVAVQFRPCIAADSATQQWVYTGGMAFVGGDGTCLRVASPNVPGSTVIHDNTQCGSGPYDDVADFTPDPGVGAGAAGRTTGQLVNYQQFGRCLDVPRQDYAWHTGSADPYLVSWPCKQTSPVGWSQVWALPGPVTAGAAGVSGLITTTAPATDPIQGSPAGRYCLRSPASTAALTFVSVVACPAGSTAPAHTTWTVTGDTGDYHTSYVIMDDSTPRYCLAPQDSDTMAADPYPFTDGYDISKIVVRSCDGSAAQKWDAPADLQRAVPLDNIGER